MAADRFSINDTLAGRKVTTADGRTAYALVTTSDSTAPSSVVATNSQTRQAETTALPAFVILAQDVNGDPALMGVLSVPAVLGAGSDRSSTTSAGVKVVAAANTSRRFLDFQNTSDTEMRVTESGVDPSATVGYQIAPGGRFNARTNKEIRVYCATAGKAYAATEG